MNESSVRTEHLPGGPDLERILREHAYRGAYLQLTVRGALVLFIALTLIFVPPMNDAGWCFAILGAYALWSAAVALWIRKGGTGPVTMIWLGLFVDLAVLATLTLLTGLAAEQSWTADILSNGLFVIPVLACTQLRTDVCVGVVACTIGVFFVSSWATMTSNSEPWPSILLSTMALAGVGAGAIGLTRIQRSRVLTIGQLVGHRTSLLAELMGLEQRERTELSEQLHDGALQYVLAARMDLDELADSAEPVALARAGKALGEATTLLRSSVSELHPTVLVHVGLARAIGDLARSAQGRGGVVVDVDTSGWNDDLRTSADDVLFGAARELLGNVVKHAGAHNVRIELARLDHRAVLVVSDDGRGISADRIAERRAAGHIGLLSHELRVVAAGGSFSVGPGEESGTLARVEIPFQIVTESDHDR
ncbi:ATP-binding protein [Rhodococcus sp. (in: high G+C Gram-positive bacteria)]|uniref:sensor histidine kinase n=1 Tax=Rhodococcus sp. TaxID=1831 RepID=UPI00257E4349|nr:ATP-binding protein [Rhodococcus sp. (in: high G+C Gram-positive bacteria)]MBQ7806725.1 ATP-binding protein [Rhodococcus sp. (in: high G+C Gram-positive bacteria)]